MKKINITILLCLLFSFQSKAQIALAKEDGTPIANGQIITYNTVNEMPANLHYKIKNTSGFPINIRIKITDIVNATGSSFQFCYLSTCLPFVTKNAVYPANSKPAISIGANSEVSNGYTMWNSDTGSGTFPIDYVIKYYMVDDFNNELGTPVTFTYRYNPNAVLNVSDVKKDQNSFANIYSTLIMDNIKIISKENGFYSIYNMEGRTISEGGIKKGENLIDSSVLLSGAYIVTLKNDKGEIISKKVIKK
ncbi:MULTISPECIES: T9SS type A sorting domain-containing protein [Chryseobacterium]|uniref:T9SS type A sorting domain-containing protein n=1 Tax=Chryseobacterium TaxID=59732 RepID=UPI001295C24E|nr:MULTISPECIES: T9SS type A sorting domain-containing protein [Chryseobacterium]MDR6921492.1 hypothetical protein [Chryseobacterium sp. 2987]